MDMEENNKQQIGGYFSTSNASKDEALKGLVAARISAAENITDGIYTSTSNLIRIATINDCSISLVKPVKTRSSRMASTGLLIPSGTVEYFSVSPGDNINIQGTANISSIE